MREVERWQGCIILCAELALLALSFLCIVAGIWLLRH